LRSARAAFCGINPGTLSGDLGLHFARLARAVGSWCRSVLWRRSVRAGTEHVVEGLWAKGSNGPMERRTPSAESQWGGLRHTAVAASDCEGIIDIMDKADTTQQWLLTAESDLRRVTNAETRFSAAMSVNHITMLAAADELDAATRKAMAWLAENPCPEVELGGRVGLMLSTCAEVALTAERALTDPTADIEAVFGRLGDLLAIIDFHSATLEAR
jgi:hypothetical protein